MTKKILMTVGFLLTSFCLFAGKPKLKQPAEINGWQVLSVFVSIERHPTQFYTEEGSSGQKNWKEDALIACCRKELGYNVQQADDQSRHDRIQELVTKVKNYIETQNNT